MALDQQSGKDELLKRTDPNDGAFIGYNDTEQKAIDCWADVLDAICATITPSSTTAAAAKAAFKSAAVGMSTPATGLAVFLAACDAYASTLGSGMAGYTTITSPSFQGSDFSSPSLNLPGVTPDAAASIQSAGVVARMSTGQSQLISPPNTTVNWS